MKPIHKELSKAVEILTQGGTVAIPTETVYGLAANALDAKAVVSIFEIKNRPSFDPLIVHIGKTSQLKNYTSDLPKSAVLLANEFWPGPMTLILPKKGIIPGITTAGLQTVGIRIPDHPLTLELLNLIDFPLAAPSANPFGYISPTSAQHVKDQLGARPGYILDGGNCSIGLESTIIGFEDRGPVIYRIGGLSRESIENLIGPVGLQLNISSDPKAPGMLKKHYAPGTKVIQGNPMEIMKSQKGKIGILSFSKDYSQLNPDFTIILSPSENLAEAARNLFNALHQLDSFGLDCIIAESFPNHGLGVAINDRLNRASAK